jgi:hypothetical protein
MQAVKTFRFPTTSIHSLVDLMVPLVLPCPALSHSTASSAMQGGPNSTVCLYQWTHIQCVTIQSTQRQFNIPGASRLPVGSATGLDTARQQIDYSSRTNLVGIFDVIEPHGSPAADIPTLFSRFLIVYFPRLREGKL